MGIDNGVSSAIAAIFPDGTWRVAPSAVDSWNGDRVLDIAANAKIVEEISRSAGGEQNVRVAYERARLNKQFGIHVICQIGRHDEFWRVLLTLKQIHFCDVDPLTWQNFCWGAKGKGNTKAKALQYVVARVPNCDFLGTYNKEQRKGIVDAMCIPFWLKSMAASSARPDVPAASLAPPPQPPVL